MGTWHYILFATFYFNSNQTSHQSTRISCVAVFSIHLFLSSLFSTHVIDVIMVCGILVKSNFGSISSNSGYLMRILPGYDDDFASA